MFQALVVDGKLESMTNARTPDTQIFAARIVRGYRVASGLNGNPRFPGGTLRMQIPHFCELGLDLTAYHLGTLNVSVAPLHYKVVQSRFTFRQVKWHPTEPPEDFSFFDIRLIRNRAANVDGLIYYPHPETKPEHVQQPDILELLLPFTEGLFYDSEIQLEIPTAQIIIKS